MRYLSGLNGAIVIRITQMTMITKKGQIMITKEFLGKDPAIIMSMKAEMITKIPP